MMSIEMQYDDWLNPLFQAVDEKNTENFVQFLDQKCLFRFGNLPVVVGVEAIKVFVDGFFDSIDSLNHNLSEVWSVPGGKICHGTVSYTRHDGSVLTIPFSNIFKIENGRIIEYLVFADTSQLYRQQ